MATARSRPSIEKSAAWSTADYAPRASSPSSPQPVSNSGHRVPQSTTHRLLASAGTRAKRHTTQGLSSFAEWRGTCYCPNVMDISRPDIKKKKLRRQIIVLAIVAVGVTAAAWAVMRLKPAVPSVDASSIWPDTVKRGDMIRNVRGLGTLTPREESIELIPAQTEATVVRILVLPGTRVTPDTVLMQLADPQLQQQLVSQKLALDGALADYKSLQATLNSTIMDKKSAAAAVNAQYSQAELQSSTDQKLLSLGVISGIQANQSKNNAEQLTAQHQISIEQLEVNQRAIQVQMASAQTKIDQA